MEFTGRKFRELENLLEDGASKIDDRLLTNIAGLRGQSREYTLSHDRYYILYELLRNKGYCLLSHRGKERKWVKRDY